MLRTARPKRQSQAPVCSRRYLEPQAGSNIDPGTLTWTLRSGLAAGMRMILLTQAVLGGSGPLLGHLAIGDEVVDPLGANQTVNDVPVPPAIVLS